MFLIRHGETEWSRIGRKQGRADSPLTPLGVFQIEACAAAVEASLNGRDCRIVSSPLGRARESAEILKCALSVGVSAFEIADCLAEHSYGNWQGLTEAEIEERWPGELGRRRQNHWGYVIPGGESYELVAGRIGPWLSAFSFAEPAIVVAHEMVSRVMRGLYQDLPSVKTLALSHPHASIYHLQDGTVYEIKAQVRAA